MFAVIDMSGPEWGSWNAKGTVISCNTLLKESQVSERVNVESDGLGKITQVNTQSVLVIGQEGSGL